MAHPNKAQLGLKPECMVGVECACSPVLWLETISLGIQVYAGLAVFEP